MKKRLGILFLTAMMCFGTTVMSYGADTNSAVETMATPRYKDIITIATYFDVSSTGKAVYTCDVETESSIRVKVSAKLQQNVNGTWKTIATDSDSNYDTYIMYEGITYVNDPNGDYRVEFTITATFNGTSETVTKTLYH